MSNRILLGVVAAIVLVVVILGFTLVGTYNSLVTLDQDTQAKWGQVQNVYQRRADLVPNLVNTVKGAANFEQQTITAVTQARAQVGQVTSGALENIARDPQAFERFQQARHQTCFLPRLDLRHVVIDARPVFLLRVVVGDGVNDAPALTQADVGFAIGAGTDVAIESAGVVLASSDPRAVASVVRLSAASYRKMLQNLGWAAGYNIVAIPLAAGVLAAWGILLTPAVGAVLMSASTVIVALNAQLLRRVEL